MDCLQCELTRARAKAVTWAVPRMSDEADPAHVNGIAFAERFNAALAAKAGGGGT